jgi:AraC-like DNA-binding protein
MQLSERYQNIIEEVHREVTSNFKPSPPVKSIAQRHGIPKTSLNFYFKQQYGITIYQLHLYTTMNFAKNRILAGEQIKNLQLLLGYKTPSSFSRAYKKVHGEAPSSTLQSLSTSNVTLLKKIYIFGFLIC